MSTTITETMTVAPMETMHMKLQAKSSVNVMPHPPSIPKPKTKLRLDPQRALEPARKKLSTLEAQRIMAVLVDSITKVELVTAMPYILENVDRYRVVLGTELVQMLEEHAVVISSFNELKDETEKLLRKERRTPSPGVDAEEGQQSPTREDDAESNQDREEEMMMGSRPMSGASMNSQADEGMRNLVLVAKQMQHSCKNIIRSFGTNIPASKAVLKDFANERPENTKNLTFQLTELKDILMCMLLTTPIEEAERNQYLKEISEREWYNAGVIQKLEAQLAVALGDKDEEIRKKNDVIRGLQSDLHQIEKFSEEHIRRSKSDAEKQEAADIKNSEGKRIKLQQEIGILKTQQQNLTSEHREEEQELRRKKFIIETQVENWIQKYDQDIGERQDEFEEIDAVYTEEKKQLNELEERFKTLETEYTQIMEERRIAQERREKAERELQRSVGAATIIQAFWRSFKVRKALKSKKKKGGGGKKKKK